MKEHTVFLPDKIRAPFEPTCPFTLQPKGEIKGTIKELKDTAIMFMRSRSEREKQIGCFLIEQIWEIEAKQETKE